MSKLTSNNVDILIPVTVEESLIQFFLLRAVTMCKITAQRTIRFNAEEGRAFLRQNFVIKHKRAR